MKKYLVPAVIAGSMIMGLIACANESEDFEKRCSDAGGEVKRESDFPEMESVAFSLPDGSGRSGSKGKKGKGKKAPKPGQQAVDPNVQNDSSAALPSTVSTPSASAKPKKRKKDDDNDFLCMMNGTILFERDA